MLEDNTDINEPKNKRIKLSEEKDTEITNNDIASTKPDFSADLSPFSNLPNEILYHHVAIFIPIEWLYVSKYLHKIAVQNLEQDPRIKWDKKSFERALNSDNVPIIIKHLSMTTFDEDFLQKQFMLAARSGSIHVLQHFLENESSILKLDPLEPKYTYIYVSVLINAISKGHKDIVILLLNSGRYVGECKATNIYLQTALRRNDKSIAMLLIENEFYTNYNFVDPIVKFISPGCDIELLQKLLNTLNGAVSYTENCTMILDRAISISANHVVEFLLRFWVRNSTPCFSTREFDERCMIIAVSQKNIAVVNLLLLDKRCNVTNLSVEAAININSRKILKRLLADERVRQSIDFRCLMLLVAKSGTAKIFKALLEDESIDVATCIDSLLITAAFFNPKPENNILTLLNCPRIDFHFYASLALCTAIENKSSYVTEAILNDPRFIVMDEEHHRLAIENATRQAQDYLISRLNKIKVARLSPSKFGPTNKE